MVRAVASVLSKHSEAPSNVLRFYSNSRSDFREHSTVNESFTTSDLRFLSSSPGVSSISFYFVTMLMDNCPADAFDIASTDMHSSTETLMFEIDGLIFAIFESVIF